MDIAAETTVAKRRDDADPGERHLVQFYEDEAYLYDSVGGWAARGLEDGEACVLVSTPQHRAGIEEQIARRGVDLERVAADGRYVALDAAELLSRCRSVGEDGALAIDESLFAEEIRRIVAPFEARGLAVRVFAEMVALLCACGETAEALRLERLWNRQSRERSFSLLCGYPIEQFAGSDNGGLLDDVCAEHHRLIPTESFSVLSTDEERMRAVVDLQRRVRSAGSEERGRREAELALRSTQAELRDRLDQLSDHDRRKNEFLASLAHELRNPLAPIRNALHLLRETGNDESVTRYATDLMERQLAHMVRLIDDLIDVSRVTRNRLELRKEIADLATVIRDSVESVRPLVHAAEQTLDVRVPEKEILLEADPVRLAQVFTNLLNNASKYAERGGRIELAVELDGAGAAVTVTDDGIGIPPEMLGRIFEMFIQVDSSQHRSRSGLGIGLALARRLVALHGGTIEAESAGAGAGSRFTVRLPLLAPRKAGDDAVRDGPDAKGAHVSRKVLVVDDSRDAAESLALLLERQGHKVRMAHDGVAAVEVAAEFLPEVILLDIGLPRLSGYDAARRIREQPWSDGMVLIALTGWGQDSDRQRTREAGIGHHLVKPVDPVQLQRLILAS